MTKRIGNLVVIAAVGALLPAAHAGNIDAIYAFGDSLSDAGNIYAYTSGAIPGAPYVNGEFSNGPTWVQDLAAGLGVGPLTPSLLGGNDYAFGGAQTGATPYHTANASDLEGAMGQISQFQAAHATADPNALYTIWIGSNDLTSIPNGSNPTAVAADIGAAVANIDTAIGTLAGMGAQNFLILTVPDLGASPGAVAAGPVAQAGASALAAAFDNTLVNGGGGLPSLANIALADSLNLNVLDTYSLVDGIVANPAAFGFTNVTQPCVTGANANYQGGTACAGTTAAQNQYLFWDNLHPTEAGHAIIGDAALAVVTPEPGSVSLMAAGILGLGLVLRRRRT